MQKDYFSKQTLVDITIGASLGIGMGLLPGNDPDSLTLIFGTSVFYGAVWSTLWNWDDKTKTQNDKLVSAGNIFLGSTVGQMALSLYQTYF